MNDKGLTFGEAIEAVKKGELACREGWNGKGMFIFQRPENCLSTDMVVNKVKSLPDAVKKWVANNYGDSETDKIKFTAELRKDVAAIRKAIENKKSPAKALRDRMIAEFTQLCDDVQKQCLS